MNPFIRRPILAMVMAILMVIVGLVAMERLPITQMPDITPPNVSVETTYTGAAAPDVEQAVATPIEQQVNGVDNMLYVKSTNGNDGTCKTEATFEVGTNLDTATMLMQNRVGQADANLPAAVKQYGLTTKKALSLPLLMYALTSPNGTWDSSFLTNYAAINIKDRLARLKGVGDVRLFGGTDYSMRVWVKPDRLMTLGLTVSDLTAAISAQNEITPAGQLGGSPAPEGTSFTYTVKTQGRLATAEEFGDIIVRSNPDGSQVRLKDVARIELGSLSYMSRAWADGKPTTGIGVYQAPGSNALQVKESVEKALAELEPGFPRDMACMRFLDTTEPISVGIKEIVTTLFEAVALVILVVFIFLQNWRATLIPLLTVPVSLVATFMVFPLLGFSINVLSLLGLVLAIGIVVDDAIVVVEAVMHHIEQGMAPKEATAQAMKEVSGPVIAIALILIAVFVPVAFMGGITGRLYQQFAVTIAISVAFSAISALTLSPALCSKLLRARKPGEKHVLDPFYAWFNRVFGRATEKYLSVTQILVRKGARSLMIVGALALLAGGLLKTVPTGFLPSEDNGYFFVNVQLPDAASQERTEAVLRKAQTILSGSPVVQHVTAASGYSLMTGTNASNTGILFVQAKPWEERKGVRQRLDIAMLLINLEFYKQIPEAQVFAFGPPPISGLGTGEGFTMMLQDRSGGTPEGLAAVAEKFVAEASRRPEIGRVNTFFRTSEPQVYADIDREKAQKLGVPVQEVNRTMGALLGSSYINDFNRFGRIYRVFLQAEPEFRTSAKSLGQFFVRGGDGQMIPLDTLVTMRETHGAPFTTRFNLYRAAEVSGVPAAGYSSDEAHRALEETAAKVLPQGFGYEWANLSYQEKKAAGTGSVVFVFALVVVFFILAAQYESWTLPFSVLLGTPFALFGAVLGLWLMRTLLPQVLGGSYVNNIFAQIGMITLIGLAAKNAILIVEYAKAHRESGMSAVDAALGAARLRLRPILMTAFAFIMGVAPLVFASGAMAEARKVIGVTVCVGMLVATVFGVFFIPALFVIVDKFGKREAGAAGLPPPGEGVANPETEGRP
ncbi:MAG TPA: multidrug efflux RND transporter permease subunit [Holophaga sp.]|nr:multidrug efflux RND transporter permease subunit [Holophaga sp.]HPS68473.1 multidrug efflux RND transporter permease subunit [Holophaga sp.]